MAYPALTRVSLAHHAFTAIHPFRDGNGRTARLLLNLQLLRAGYTPALLLREWRQRSIQALAMADRGRFGPILTLIGRAVEQGLDLYLDACARTPPDEDHEQLPLSELAAQTGHTAEYLALLIRKGRLDGVKRGSRWHSSLAAVRRYEREVREQTYPRGRPRKGEQDSIV